MTEPSIFCSVCGLGLENPRLANEMVIIKPGEKMIGPQLHQRMFEGECPEHGHRFVSCPSEGHSTILASKLLKRFTKAECIALRKLLPDADRKKFQAALNGHYYWDERDIANWKQHLK